MAYYTGANWGTKGYYNRVAYYSEEIVVAIKNTQFPPMVHNLGVALSVSIIGAHGKAPVAACRTGYGAGVRGR